MKVLYTDCPSHILTAAVSDTRFLGPLQIVVELYIQNQKLEQATFSGENINSISEIDQAK